MFSVDSDGQLWFNGQDLLISILQVDVLGSS